ncbi:hypothetical protein [Nocardioides ultimimeridianus]
MRRVRQVGGYYLAGCVLVALILVVVALVGLAFSPDMRDQLLLRQHEVTATVGTGTAPGQCGRIGGPAAEVDWTEHGVRRTGWLSYCARTRPRPGDSVRVAVTPSSKWAHYPGHGSIYLTGLQAILFGGALLAVLGLIASLLPGRAR